MSEPAILVRRLTGSQVWSMEKLENKLIDMREIYQEYKDRPSSMVRFLQRIEKFFFFGALEFPSNLRQCILYHISRNFCLLMLAPDFSNIRFREN